MCKDRIEAICYKNKNVKYAEWNSENNTLQIKFSEDFNIEDLKTAIAKKGHDTDTVKASDKAYNKLHECCKYRAEG